MKFFRTRNVCYFLFITNFFLLSCSTSTVESKSTKNLASKKINTFITEDEREWMDRFFKELFLESAAIYTLFGSKPISGQSIIDISSKEYQKNVLAFGLPFNTDPILEKYKLERKKIIKNLNKSNFFEAVLLQLVGELSQEKISKN